MVGRHRRSSRVLLSDLIVITMEGASFADSGARASTAGVSSLARSVRGLVPGVRVAQSCCYPLEPTSGRGVFYVTTAPVSAREFLVSHLEEKHGCTVLGTSDHLSHLVHQSGPWAWRPTSLWRAPTSFPAWSTHAVC